jgi:hypothetical protein
VHALKEGRGNVVFVLSYTQTVCDRDKPIVLVSEKPFLKNILWYKNNKKNSSVIASEWPRALAPLV